MSLQTCPNFQAQDIWPIESNVPNLNPLLIKEDAEASFVALFHHLETSIFMSTEEWKTNPFHRNFKPGMKTGQQIFLKKTKGVADGTHHSLTKNIAGNIHQFFRSHTASLRSCIQVPIEFNADGSTKTFANLIMQHAMVNMKDVQCSAHGRFSMALSPTDPISPSPFATHSIDPANDNNDKKVFTIE